METKVSVEQKSDVEREINIEIPRALYDEKFNKALRNAANTVHLKGFRPGRAPKAYVAKLFGGRIHNEVVGDLVSQAYRDAIDQHELKVIGQPEIDFGEPLEEDPTRDLTVTAQVSILPEPEIANSTGLSFEVEVVEFSEELVERELENFRQSRATIEPLEGRTAIEAGDLVKLDYQATVDEKEFSSSKADDLVVELGKGMLPEELETKLIGEEVGSTPSIEVSLPEDFHDNEVAGKTAVYSVTLKELQQRILPELDDELAKQSGFAEDLAGLKSHLSEQLEKSVAQQNKSAREEKLVEALIAANPFDVPRAMVLEEIRNMLFEMRFLDPNQEESYRFDVSRFYDNFGEMAEPRVRRQVILDRLLQQDEIEISDEQLESWLNDKAEEIGQTREEINRVFGFPNNAVRLKEVVAKEGLIERLLGESTISEVTKKEDTKD